MEWEPYRGETVVGDVRVLRTALDRDLYAYLPPSYDGTRRFPVLYMHDGLNLFDESQLRTLFVPDAIHHESAWRLRLPDALCFLLPVAG